MASPKIPILLLKTKSTPNDSYDEYFSTPTSPFTPIFVPVLQHKPNLSNLEAVKALLRDGGLRRKYGGMIFTSQRAVEGFAQVVQELEREKGSVDGAEEKHAQDNTDRGFEMTQAKPPPPSPVSHQHTPIFPLYTVGPATSRTLETLLSTSPSVLAPLHPKILGSHTGNGAALAEHILEHYRAILHGPLRQQKARRATRSTSNTVEDEDNRPESPIPPLPPLLFLVGEQRRDIIPKTLTSDSLPPDARIKIDELVVYETDILESFPDDFNRALQQTHQVADDDDDDAARTIKAAAQLISAPSECDSVAVVVVVVVFSPSGCRQMLRRLGFLDENRNRQTHTSTAPPPPPPSEGNNTHGVSAAAGTGTRARTRTKYIIATIGPTTSNHLATEFGFRPHVCAARPTPEGVMDGVLAYLRHM